MQSFILEASRRIQSRGQIRIYKAQQFLFKSVIPSYSSYSDPFSKSEVL